MKIIIHRGTQQIGGNIIEINSEKARIIIDFGAELPDDKKTNDIKIEGVNVGKTNCDAVFLSHYHIDHIGLYKEVLTGIPINIGKVAKEILLRQALYLKDDGITKIETFKTYKVLKKVVIKDIIITPILIDHSAFDAYMFLIENNGKRILYTGDFRTHGFKGKALISTLKKHVSQVDLLISEGTALSRNKEACINENRIKEIAKKHL